MRLFRIGLFILTRHDQIQAELPHTTESGKLTEWQKINLGLLTRRDIDFWLSLLSRMTIDLSLSSVALFIDSQLTLLLRHV